MNVLLRHLSLHGSQTTVVSYTLVQYYAQNYADKNLRVLNSKCEQIRQKDSLVTFLLIHLLTVDQQPALKYYADQL